MVRVILKVIEIVKTLQVHFENLENHVAFRKTLLCRVMYGNVGLCIVMYGYLGLCMAM